MVRGCLLWPEICSCYRQNRGNVVTAKSSHSWGGWLHMKIQMHWLRFCCTFKAILRRAIDLFASTPLEFSGLLESTRPLFSRRSLFYSPWWFRMPVSSAESLLSSEILRMQEANWIHLGKLRPTFHSKMLFLKFVKGITYFCGEETHCRAKNTGPTCL
jgi:hypothetical protein